MWLKTPAFSPRSETRQRHPLSKLFNRALEVLARTNRQEKEERTSKLEWEN